MPRKQVGLPVELVDRVDREAKRRGMSRTAFVEDAVVRALANSVAGRVYKREKAAAAATTGGPKISDAKLRARRAYPKASKR